MSGVVESPSAAPGEREGDWSVTLVVCGSWTVLQVSGDLDLAAADDLRARLGAAIEQAANTPQARIAIDPERVSFCDSIGLGDWIVAEEKYVTPA